jgi:hypothetical protein
MAIRHDGRTVRGTIRRRDQARAVYERAKKRGQLAALLDQERPNLFTQSVANLAAGAVVEVELRYVEALAQRDGGYELVFPWWRRRATAGRGPRPAGSRRCCRGPALARTTSTWRWRSMPACR